MPSCLVGHMSGGQLIISGNPYSGRIVPVGGIQFATPQNGGANLYIALSGNMTVSSGVGVASGVSSGFLDGMILRGASTYFIPRICFPVSGTFNVYAMSETPATSGVPRLYWEVL